MWKLNDFNMPLAFLLISLSVKSDRTFVAVSNFFFKNICEKVPFWTQLFFKPLKQFVFTTFAFSILLLCLCY